MAKKDEVVAEVEVELMLVKFWRVEEEVTRRFFEVRSVVDAVIALKVVAKRSVDVASVEVELPVTRRSLPIVTRPLDPVIVSAEVDVVAVPATVVVAK